MRAVVVYESMYGNTRAVAAQIAAGLGPDAVALPVARATPEALADADLVVVGGPTHAWGMSRPTTRKGAADAASKPASGLSMEPGADGPGLREWLGTLGRVAGRAAAFDTRMHAPAGLSGSAGRPIARQLRAHGFELAAKPECFYVTKANHLDDGEQVRARSWGEQLASLAHAG